MIGWNYQCNMIKKIKTQSGQVLLVVVLVSFLLTVIGFSLFQITTQEIRLSKLEEESKKAFAAAEAALEARLQAESDIIDINSLSLGSEIVAGQALVDNSTSSVFTSPVLKKDEQYTFYLSQYNPQTQRIEGNAFSGGLKINIVSPEDFCSQEISKMAVELTFINIETSEIKRRLIDPCLIIEGSIDEWSINHFYSSPLPSHLLILRILALNRNFPGTQLVIENQLENWPIQGRNIVSTATTKSGVSKKIKLFQSYPQLPAEFFITSF